MLQGVSVLVVGAGLAGLTAARDLMAMGAAVTVVEARNRVGGRVWTVRDGFAEGQHAEAGGDFIDENHEELRRLAESLNLELVQILRHGWSYATRLDNGTVRAVPVMPGRGWERLAAALDQLGEPYRLAERRWDTPIAASLARRSVRQWLDDVQADADLCSIAAGLRGFFLADPEDLSLLALVDQFAAGDPLGAPRIYRVVGGTDRITGALAASLGDRLKLNTELVAISQRGARVRASLRHRRQAHQFTCDYLVCTLPTSILKRVPITPALPAQQHDAIATLKYGRATKSLLQFSSRFWRVPRKPSAYGTALPFGAVWDGNEEQRGKPAILSLMAGAGASDWTIEIVGREGSAGLAKHLDWLGSSRAQLLHAHHVSWELDPFARGGYAFFDPSFPPARRSWLAQPSGRLFFAGEHTSLRWQGYMNGAVESGRRAAAEVAATHTLSAATGRPSASRR